MPSLFIEPGHENEDDTVAMKKLDEEVSANASLGTALCKGMSYAWTVPLAPTLYCNRA